MIEKLYTTKEVAELTGLSHFTIRAYAREGKIESMNRGQAYVFTAKMINDFNDRTLTKNKGKADE